MNVRNAARSGSMVAAVTLLALLIGAGCQREPKVSVVKAVLDQDEVAYRQQAALYEEQLKTTERQQERTEQQLQRMEALLAHWEKQADRYDALLARWEKQAGVKSK